MGCQEPSQPTGLHTRVCVWSSFHETTGFPSGKSASEGIPGELKSTGSTTVPKNRQVPGASHGAELPPAPAVPGAPAAAPPLPATFDDPAAPAAPPVPAFSGAPAVPMEPATGA